MKSGNLDALRFHQVDNSHYRTSFPMQLYLLRQIERVCQEKWGSREPYIVALREFSSECLVRLDEDPKRIESLIPEKFQYLVADRLDQWGLEAQLVGKINERDGGSDLIAYPKTSPATSSRSAPSARSPRPVRRSTWACLSPTRGLHPTRRDLLTKIKSSPAA